MSTILTVEELVDAVDLDLGTSDWLVVTQDRIDLFADATGDHQWIHVDPERAAHGPFGATVAHGYLTLSLVPELFDGLLDVTDLARGVNYGIERLRFTAPVLAGSSVRLAARVLAARRKADGGVEYRVALRMEIEGSQRPAMVAECLFLAYG
jgi:acyl dehydratase